MSFRYVHAWHRVVHSTERRPLILELIPAEPSTGPFPPAPLPAPQKSRAGGTWVAADFCGHGRAVDGPCLCHLGTGRASRAGAEQCPQVLRARGWCSSCRHPAFQRPCHHLQAPKGRGRVRARRHCIPVPTQQPASLCRMSKGMRWGNERAPHPHGVRRVTAPGSTLPGRAGPARTWIWK